ARYYYAAALETLAHLDATAANQRRQVDLLFGLVQASITSVRPTENLGRLEQAEVILQSLGDPASGAGQDRQQVGWLSYWRGFTYYSAGQMGPALIHFQQGLVSLQTA